MINAAVLGSVGLGYALLLGPQLSPQDAPRQKETEKTGFTDPGAPTRTHGLSLKSQSFEFVRIKHSADADHQNSHWSSRWLIGYPESDQKFSAWFEKTTGVKTETNKVLSLTAPDLQKHAFIYITEPGRMELSTTEALALREYLLGGGFLMVDDFWGEREWANVAEAFRKVFPDQVPFELPIQHPIFHCYYDIAEKPQVPNRIQGLQSESTGITWERSDAKEPHFRGLVDPRGRLVTVFCHNTALANGWKAGDTDDYYSKEFSHKKAFPMGINIVIYALAQ